MNSASSLNADQIAALAPGFVLEVHGLIDSTQTLARTRVAAGLRSPCAIFADAQSAGRGQRGRVWHSPPGAAIYSTVVWPSARGLGEFSGLSLVVGLAVCATLAKFGLDARLKWPNDVWIDGRKLAGVLVEIGADQRGSWALIGIGLNIELPASTREIDQPWTDLAQLMVSPPPRSQLAGMLLNELQARLEEFEQQGFGAFLNAWNAADALAGKPIWVTESERRVRAVALGVDALGRLRVHIDGRERSLVAGEVSVRDE